MSRHCASLGSCCVRGSGRRQQALKEDGRGDDFNAFAFQLRRHPAQQRVIAEMRQAGEKTQGALVGREVLQQRGFADAAGHHRLRDAGVVERCG